VVVAASKASCLPALNTTRSYCRARVAAVLESRKESVASLIGRDARAYVGAVIGASATAVTSGRAGPLAGLDAGHGG